MKKESFCPAPFMGIYINGDKASPCCWFDRTKLNNNLNDHSIKQVFDGQIFDNIRNKMLAGEELPECSRCDTHDVSEQQSHRELWQKRALKSNLNFQTTGEKSLHSIDLFLGNECNLACLTCNSYNSHKWIDDEKAIYDKSFAPQKKNLEINDYSFLDHVKRLKLAGGEVLLMKEHTAILNYLIGQELSSDIELAYVTNGTVPHSFFEKEWSKFKSVHFIFSVDGINEVYDAIRWPAKWIETSTKITDYIGTTSKYTFSLNCVVSSLNILDIPKIHEWWKKLGQQDVTYRIIDSPSHLRLSALTDSQINTAIECIKGQSHFQHIEHELLNIKHSQDDKAGLSHFLGKISDQRNYNFMKLLPDSRFNSL